MFRTIIILILIAVLAALALAAALPLISWVIRMAFSIIVVVAAVMAILFLVKKLRT